MSLNRIVQKKFDDEMLKTIGINALIYAWENHQNLGDRGFNSVRKNIHGENSLTGDIEAERAIIKTFERAKVPLRIISEEHSEFDISKEPKYLAVIDGLDGTNVYKSSNGKGRYGTMLGIFSNLDPSYEDYIFSGIMEHSTNKLYFATRNQGAFLITNKIKEPLKCSSQENLDGAIIYADKFFDKDRNSTFMQDMFLSKLTGYELQCKNSTAIHYADLVTGMTDLVLECTRKGNLELAVAFGLVKESNGDIVTIECKSIKNEKYLTWGQKEYLPTIATATHALAQELIKKLDK